MSLKETGLGALAMCAVTWRGCAKATRRTGAVVDEAVTGASRRQCLHRAEVERHSQGVSRRRPQEMRVSKSTPELPSAGQFPSTHWSRVVAAGDMGGPKARESLAALCNAYWYPLYAYIRRRGYSSEQAQDLTQDFFTRILEKGLFAEADPGRGPFPVILASGVLAVFDESARDGEDSQARRRAGRRYRLTRLVRRDVTLASLRTS